MAKTLSAYEWVALAASTDNLRPVLRGIHVNGQLTATDSYRVHRAAGTDGRAPGLWDARTGAPIEGTYPNVDAITPMDAPTHEIVDLDELRAVVAANIAYGKAGGHCGTTLISFLSANGRHVYLNTTYLAPALRAMDGAFRGTELVKVLARNPEFVVRFDFPVSDARTAVFMPVRIAASGDSSDPSARFDVSELITPIAHS